jgi:hypothetical protein
MKEEHYHNDDLESPLIQRCATAIGMGVDKSEVIELCLQEGQDPHHAELTYAAARLLHQTRKDTEATKAARKKLFRRSS